MGKYLKTMSKTTKTILWIIVAIIVIGLVWYAVSKKPETVTKEEETIKIGAVLPLTGDFSEYGHDELNSFNLFIKNYNTNPDHKYKLSLIVEDSMTDSAAAVSAVNKILIEKPTAIFTIGSSLSLAIQPIINENKIVTFAVGANPDIPNNYMIANMPSSDDQMKALSVELQNMGINKIGFIYRNDDWGNSLLSSFDATYSGEIIAEPFNPDEKDYRTVIAKVKVRNPEAVFLANTGADLGYLIQQVRLLMGKTITIYSVPEVAFAEVKQTAGEFYSNIVYVSFDLDYDSRDTLKQFKEKYIAEYGRDPSFDSLVAYNSIELLVQCPLPINSGDLLHCLKSRKFNTLVGEVFIENNRIVYPLKINKI